MAKAQSRKQTSPPPGIPTPYHDIFYDHITLAFDVPKTAVVDFIGKKAQAKVYAHAYNQDVEAVRVTTYSLPDTYGVPHITLSTQKGIQPFGSVAMIKNPHNEEAAEPSFDVYGKIEFVALPQK